MNRQWSCEICKAPKGEPCVDTIKPGRPLPGRSEHFARALPPGRSKPKDDRNDRNDRNEMLA